MKASDGGFLLGKLQRSHKFLLPSVTPANKNGSPSEGWWCCATPLAPLPRCAATWPEATALRAHGMVQVIFELPAYVSRVHLSSVQNPCNI